MEKLIKLSKFTLITLMICLATVSCKDEDLKTEEPFTVLIETSPEDATVLINGVEIKYFNTKTNSPEEIKYEVSKEGYDTLQGTHLITKSEILKLVLNEKGLNTITINTIPEDAKMLINGVETKTHTTKTYEAEEIEYEISKEGYETLKAKYEITKTETLNLELRKLNLHTLTISTTPEDARVMINGKEVKTFTTKTEEPEEVEYEVSKEGYATVTGKHLITETFTLPITLKKTEKYLAAVKNADNKWGYINKEGNTIIEFQYQFATPFANGVAVVQKEDGKWIIIDKTGEQTATVTGDYNYASPFYGEYAIVGTGEGRDARYGMIKKDGSIFIAVSEANATLDPFVDGLAKYAGNWQKAGYYNTRGKSIVGENLATRSNPRGGFGFFRPGRDKFNMIDNSGTKIGKEWKDAYAFSNANEDYYAYKGGLTSNLIAAVKIKGEGYGNDFAGYINDKGETVIEFKYKDTYPFSDGLAVVFDESRNPGIIKLDGSMLVECSDKYRGFKFFFTDGMIGVMQSNKWGFMDKTGKEIVEPTYYKLNYFVDGIVSVMKDRAEDLWGAIDKTGKQVLGFKYEKVYNSNQGLILVQEGFGDLGIFKFFDHSGKEVINNNYKSAWYFTEVDTELPYWTRLDLASVKIVEDYPATVR